MADAPNTLDYLGFSFDGHVVTIRNKTISKYYYRMYRKVKAIVKSDGITKNGNRISAKNLYMKYSIKGAYFEGKNAGNFLTYVRRAKKIFVDQEAIDRSTKYHMDKVRKQLKKIDNTLAPP